MPKRKEFSSDLGEATVSAITMGRVRGPFPTNMESITIVFSGIDIPANSPNGQAMVCSEKLYETPGARSRTLEQASVSMLHAHFKTVFI